jgi:HK97 family phage major capsid protein
VTELDSGAAKSVWTFNAPAGITLCERKGMTILRDPYTSARNGEVWFILSARFGFGITDPLAIYYLLHPTA